MLLSPVLALRGCRFCFIRDCRRRNLAALAAKGPSNVQGISLIDRGYADFRGKLEALGADFD